MLKKKKYKIGEKKKKVSRTRQKLKTLSKLQCRRDSYLDWFITKYLFVFLLKTSQTTSVKKSKKKRKLFLKLTTCHC